jgi:amino acid adenylation domain-containing protein
MIFDGGLGAALVASARRHADRPALWAVGDRSSYRELFERAGGWAVGMRERGLEPGDRVCILSHRTTTAYAGVLAALLAGCTYVPLNTRFPRERNQAILASADAGALVADDESAGDLETLTAGLLRPPLVVTPERKCTAPDRVRRLGPSDLSPVPLDRLAAADPGDPNSPAYLLFTSGTTGAPKGVPISHANLAAYLSSIHPLVPIAAADRVLQAVDLTFDLSAHDMFLSWLNGAELYSAPENATILAPRIIAEHKLTACLLVPSAAARAREQGLLERHPMPSLRYSLFAGEALPVSVARAWCEAAPNSALYNLYGPTEGTIHVSQFRFDPARELPSAVVPIGWPLGDQRMVLFDADGREVPAGDTGEIHLAGPQMTRGYWRAPHLDAEKFATIGGVRWYKTGDLGRHLDRYGILFGGRADRQVKIRGYRVELQEIEGVLRNATRREQVAVIAWPLSPDGIADGCIAFVAGAEMDAASLRAACRTALPPYMVPNELVFVPELPLNPNGKTDYKALYSHDALTRHRPGRGGAG